MIVAMTPSGIIGKDGGLPWKRLPGDLPRFKRLTMGKPCIMGRKTYDSIPKILEGRLNIVVSRQLPVDDLEYFKRKLTRPLKLPADNLIICTTILEAWIKAAESGAEEAFIIGGAEVYQQALPSCDRLYLTIVSKELPGDVRLDLPLNDDWTLTDREYIDGPTPYQNLILDRATPMTKFMKLERLPDNDLPHPRYATPLSAGLDFSACLGRPCKLVAPGSGNKTDFYALPPEHKNTHRTQDGEEVYAYQSLVYRRGPNRSPDSLAAATLCLAPGETVLVPLGFKCSFNPDCVLKFYPRSSVGLKGLVLANGTGIIDPDYRGELFAAVVNRTEVPIEIKHGERIVQGIITPFIQGIITEGPVDSTARGEGGLGSTGRMAIADAAEAAGPQQQ